MIEEILAKIGQKSLLLDWESWSQEQKENFRKQVEELDVKAIEQQRRLIASHKKSVLEPITPFTDYVIPPKGEEGRKLVEKGAVACLVVAGGQGIRLGFDGPKGAFPVTAVKHKSLFQLVAEKTLAAGKGLSLAIMTSPLNHQATFKFFEENNSFGLAEEQLDLFCQGTFPFLDDEGNLFLEAPGKIATGPNGNGSSLRHLVNFGIWDKWKKRGVSYVIFIQIDNALADPFDAALVEAHVLQDNEVTVKCIQRDDPHEDVGILAKKGDDVVVVEYSEIGDEERVACDESGALVHSCANISYFCFDMAFIERVAKGNFLPYHFAYKETPAFDKTIKAFKSERFIFDVLPKAKKVGAILDARKHCFAPLKNASGPNSIEDVQESLQLFDRKVFKELTQTDALPGVIELHPSFYYPDQDLRLSWQKRIWSPGVLYLLP